MSYQINICTVVKGNAFSLDVKENDTIRNVKEKICGSEGVPANCQKLFIKKICGQGKLLEDDKTLSYYNITSDCNLYLSCTLRPSS